MSAMLGSSGSGDLVGHSSARVGSLAGNCELRGLCCAAELRGGGDRSPGSRDVWVGDSDRRARGRLGGVGSGPRIGRTADIPGGASSRGICRTPPISGFGTVGACRSGVGVAT